jgi:MFS family permease
MELCRMLVEPLSLENSMGAARVEPSAIGWVVFVLLIGIAVLGVPLGAALVRRFLPARERRRAPLAPMSFGSSQKVKRSPRHAVLLHRSLIVSLFIALVVFFLVPGVLAIRMLGVSAIQVGLTLALPTLLVTLHARRRGQGT